MRSLLRWIGRGFSLILAVIVLYILAAVGGSIWPRNTGWEESEAGILLYVADNGIHTGLVLPRSNAIADWSDLVRPEHLADPRHAADHLLFGWGDRQFYLETPTWGDLDPGTAIAAVFGSGATLLHVDHVRNPQPAPNMRPFRVTRDQYRAIAAAIRADFRLDQAGDSQPIEGYGASDVFYEAEGRYGPLRTCNEWTGEILRDAGVRMGAWTPFSFGVMRWFPEPRRRPGPSRDSSAH